MDMQRMLEQLIVFSVRKNLETMSEHWTKAIRFEFRAKEEHGAIALLFHANNPNKNFIGIYALDEVTRRQGGRFPDLSSTSYRFITDHDSSTADGVHSFFEDHEKFLSGWDWVDPFRIVDISEFDRARLESIRFGNHVFSLKRR